MYTLDPAQHTVSLGAIDIQGFAKGTFIEAERDEEAFTDQVGSDGTVTRVYNSNQMGNVTITIVQGTDSNDRLSALALLDEGPDHSGVRPLLVKDLLGTTVYRSTEAWIKKLPKGEHANEAKDRVWVIRCAKLEMNVGGSDSSLDL